MPAAGGALVEQIRLLAIFGGQQKPVCQKVDGTAFDGCFAFAGKAEQAGVDGVAVTEPGRENKRFDRRPTMVLEAVSVNSVPKVWSAPS